MNRWKSKKQRILSFGSILGSVKLPYHTFGSPCGYLGGPLGFEGHRAALRITVSKADMRDPEHRTTGCEGSVTHPQV